MTVVTRQKCTSRGAENQRRHRERVKKKIEQTEEELSELRASNKRSMEEIASLRAVILGLRKDREKIGPRMDRSPSDVEDIAMADTICVKSSPLDTVADPAIDTSTPKMDGNQAVPSIETPGPVTNEGDPFLITSDSLPLYGETGTRRLALSTDVCGSSAEADRIFNEVEFSKPEADWASAVGGDVTEFSLPPDYFDLDFDLSTTAKCQTDKEGCSSERNQQGSGVNAEKLTVSMDTNDQSFRTCNNRTLNIGEVDDESKGSWSMQPTPLEAHYQFAPSSHSGLSQTASQGLSSWPDLGQAADASWLSVPATTSLARATSSRTGPPPLPSQPRFPSAPMMQIPYPRDQSHAAGFGPAFGGMSETQAGLVALHYLFNRIVPQLSREPFSHFPMPAY